MVKGSEVTTIDSVVIVIYRLLVGLVAVMVVTVEDVELLRAAILG